MRQGCAQADNVCKSPLPAEHRHSYSFDSPASSSTKNFIWSVASLPLSINSHTRPGDRRAGEQESRRAGGTGQHRRQAQHGWGRADGTSGICMHCLMQRHCLLLCQSQPASHPPAFPALLRTWRADDDVHALPQAAQLRRGGGAAHQQLVAHSRVCQVLAEEGDVVVGLFRQVPAPPKQARRKPLQPEQPQTSPALHTALL